MAHLYLADAVPEGGGIAVLNGDEARHAGAVARLRVGETVLVGDGRGRVASAEALTVGRDHVELRVLSVRTDPRPMSPMMLVQALAKGGRDEQAVQAAVELGAAAVVPWQAERSVVRWVGPKTTSGVERWASIAREAGKQAMRAWAPEVLPLHLTADLAVLSAGRRVLVLEPTAAIRLADAVPKGALEDIVVVVGPEGGIADDELELLTEAGAVPVRLGPTVLRTSTAGPAALAALSLHLGLW